MNALPFACIRPVPERAAEVAALPYDVFTSAEAAAYARERPLSFLNIDRPEIQFEDGHDPYAPEVYERASALLQQWLTAGIYTEDGQPAYYVYELGCGPEGTESEPGGADGTADASVATGPAPRTQTGIVAVCPIDDFLSGTIRRHEKTRPEKELDRVNHITALDAQTGPIFLSYRDMPAVAAQVREATGSAPLYDFSDNAGCHQRVWRVAEPVQVTALSSAFEAVSRAYIADGHHRTAGAVHVGLERRAAAQAAGTFTGLEPFNYVLCVLFPANELRILPYNRVVLDRCGLNTAELVSAVRASGFDVAHSRGPVEPLEPGVVGMYCEGAWWRLRVQQPTEKEATRRDPVSALDISILQDRVLGPVLGIDDPRTNPRIRFVGGVRSTSELERIAGSEGAAFSLHATGIQQLFDVADAGLLMPPKSTWFEPKPRSGLFIHRI